MTAAETPPEAAPPSLFDRYFFGPVDLLRPYLLVRGLLALLAFDCWLELAPYGYRYGLGDFNVAHFALLDTLLPMPTPALYVSVVLASGWLALVMALAGPTRWGMAALTLGYTLAWSCSLLDAYQHHYLLSLLLAAMTCFPTPSFATAMDSALHDEGGPLYSDPTDPGREAPRAWGYVLFCVSCAIVYFYTAITKMNVDWRDGHALARLAGGTPAARDMVAFAQEHGVSAEVFWSAFAKSAIALQLIIAAGFVLAPVFDRMERLRARRVLAFWVLAPLSFHVGAAHMNLKIGWFSEYMMVVAGVVFLPRELLAGVAYVLGTPQRVVGVWLDAEHPSVGASVAGALVTGVGLVLVFGLVDLPGDRAAGVLAAVGLVALALLPLLRKDRSRALPVALAALVATGSLLMALVESDARFDYYRKAGGDSLRLASADDPHYALDAVDHYRQAQRYYPDAYRDFWRDWDREAAARVARGDPALNEQRARMEGAPPRDRSRKLSEAEALVAQLRARGLLPPAE